jgi:deoxyribonuclease-4
MAISFGPGGNSESWGKRKFPEQLPEYLASMGLNGYEIECGRGVRLSEKTPALLPGLAQQNGIYVTLHAPYFISLSSVEEETRLKSVEYIFQSAQAAHSVGARKIVVHSGSCSKMTREQATELAKDTLKRAQERLDSEGLSEIIICPETMGKVNQLGTLDEVLALCSVDERMIPCVDFGHLYARSQGTELNDETAPADYAAILDAIAAALPGERAKKFHAHFSRIAYTKGGEKCHLTFADTAFGPPHAPLLALLKERHLAPTIICESAGTQAEDAAALAHGYAAL